MTNDRGPSLVILETDLESPETHSRQASEGSRDIPPLPPLLFTSGRTKPGHPALGGWGDRLASPPPTPARRQTRSTPMAVDTSHEGSSI